MENSRNGALVAASHHYASRRFVVLVSRFATLGDFLAPIAAEMRNAIDPQTASQMRVEKRNAADRLNGRISQNENVTAQNRRTVRIFSLET
jgi:hypothetical protein